MIAGIVGLYADHNFDDRDPPGPRAIELRHQTLSDSNYYSKAQSDTNYYAKAAADAKLAGKQDKPIGILVVDHAAFHIADTISFNSTFRHSAQLRTLDVAHPSCHDAQVSFRTTGRSPVPSSMVRATTRPTT